MTNPGGVGWEGLVATALLGTARRPPDVAAPPGAPGDLDAVLRTREPEEAVLAAAAAWAVARRSGVRPRPAAPPEAAPRDERPLCSPAAASRLAAMLDGEHPRLLPEWLALAAAANLRPPPELLPRLLSAATRQPQLRAAVDTAAGPRGPWLTARRPDWASPHAGADHVWAAGSRPARRELLATLRRADPKSGRELLLSTWDEESADDRSAFLAELAHGLGPDDEPFLETVLDDRRKQVRRAAADLLWSLPSSRLAARMAERTRPLITAGRRLEVELPKTYDADMDRDGIEQRPPAGSGERQFWLAQMIEATPLPTWPLELADKKGDFADLVRAAWARAALRQGNADWARALYSKGHRDLLPLLPKAERERAAAKGTLEDALECPGPWGAALSRAVLRSVTDDLTRAERDEIALRLHPDALDEATELCDLAGFRAGMLRELR